MSEDFKAIATGALQFLLGALLSVLAIVLYVVSSARPLEIESWLEIGQEALLFLTSFCFAFAAGRSPGRAGGLYLVAGFVSVCFIRELDACFDVIFHGAWKYIALAYLAFLYLVLRRAGFRTIVPGVAWFVRSRSFAMALPGVVVILVYSRLFGSKVFWDVMSPGVRNFEVKTLSEESAELLGYAILFGASLIAARGRDDRPDGLG